LGGLRREKGERKLELNIESRRYLGHRGAEAQIPGAQGKDERE